MNQPSSGPPNPRHARYRQIPIQSSGCPVTIFLIVICCAVAAISGIGSHTAPVASLYFSKPASKELLKELEKRVDALEASDGEDSPSIRKSSNSLRIPR